MRAWCRRVVFAVSVAACSGWTAPALAADPVIMFLLGIARDIAVSAAKRPSTPAPLPPAAQTYPGTVVEPWQLRRLIDDSFLYLSSRQRAEIFNTLNNLLLDPKNAAMRAPMIEQFVQQALAVRAAQLRLAQLSEREMQMMAQEFRREVTGLSEEERQQLLGILERGLLPVPASLNRMLLSQLNAAESQTATQ